MALALAASPAEERPTAGILTVPHIDCISRQVSPADSRNWFNMARSGRETDAFVMAESPAMRCRKDHGWTQAQTRTAFRVALMDGWMREDGLISKIRKIGDFRDFLDSYYADNVKPDGRHILEHLFVSGKMDRDLTAEGYPADPESRELAYNYWEWRGALWDLEEEFRKGASDKP
ncbi:hypothetical protein [Parasphingorhabdus marina]|nr:hypothetical protein [Parasphingorhabdus marina]